MRILLVGAEHVFAEAEWVEAIGRVMGWNGHVVLVAQEDLPPHLVIPLDWRHHLVADTSRIRTELDYHEPIDETEGLRRTIKWQRERRPASEDHRLFDYAVEDQAIAIADRGGA